LNYTIFLGFRGEEVLLNRAESFVSQNNITAAIADLQLLVSKRYRGTATVTLNVIRNHYSGLTTAQAFSQYIHDERRKEFIHEGLEWFDIKRFDVAVTHEIEDGSTITLTANDKRKVLQIPQAAIDIGGLQPNPR
jgi:hypothetical protein